MHNNILNGWRQAITKILVVCGLVYLISISVPTIASAFGKSSKWTCGSSVEVGEALSDNNENVIATGSISNGEFLMSFWANQYGDWTVVATGENASYSCVVVHGKGFKTLRTKTFI
jgi:hypothetical protein